ncbi:hypothetical protein GN958_ATG14366 [Phytophthora infestans]|uniref:Uncharacterized protein n=1 Tax=Phytophthora infestans TaxID=4787 RepID=A0A8S9UAB9_PHYIN|nr:hypothetical protein GN958_ATG14366 [Phytophthora infestans]
MLSSVFISIGDDATSDHWNSEIEEGIYVHMRALRSQRRSSRASRTGAQGPTWKKLGFVEAVCEEGKWHLENYRSAGQATILKFKAEQ